GHGAVGVCRLADHPGRCAAGEPAKVDRGLGLASANEHATLPCLEREDVSGLDEVVRFGGGIGEKPDRPRAVRRTDAGRDAVASVDTDGERGAEAGLGARGALWTIE